MSDQVTTNELLDFMQEHMVTKQDLDFGLKDMEHRILDSMDDKMADMKGDLVILMRKEDRKVTDLINLLSQKEVISNEEAGALLALEPFPQM